MFGTRLGKKGTYIGHGIDERAEGAERRTGRWVGSCDEGEDRGG